MSGGPPPSAELPVVDEIPATDELPASEEKHHLRISLGILFFILIMLMAVITVGVVSLRSLVTHEEGVTLAWSGIQIIQDSRRVLLSDIIHDLEEAGHAFTWRDRWQEAREEADTAQSFSDEVPAVAALDAASDRLLMEIRACTGIDSLLTVMMSIGEVDRLNAGLGVSRRAYNERVREYEGERDRIPIRWFARLFGFSEAPEYLRVVVR